MLEPTVQTVYKITGYKINLAFREGFYGINTYYTNMKVNGYKINLDIRLIFSGTNA